MQPSKLCGKQPHQQPEEGPACSALWRALGISKIQHFCATNPTHLGCCSNFRMFPQTDILNRSHISVDTQVPMELIGTCIIVHFACRTTCTVRYAVPTHL